VTVKEPTMHVQSSALRKTGLAAGVVVLLAGCGGRGAGDGSDFSKESATDILTAAATDMQALKTVRMAGRIEASGQQIGFDLQLTTQGDCQGTFKVGDGSARIIASGGDSWMKPDHEFWTMQAGRQASQIEGLVGDKWVAIPADSSLSSVCDLDSFLDKIKDPGNDKKSSATVVGTDTVAGHDAVQVRDMGRGDDKTDGWVSADDPHYLLKLEVTGSGGGTVTFSDFDSDVTIKAPDPSDVVDLSRPTG
jgi:hypothetical protein